MLARTGRPLGFLLCVLAWSCSEEPAPPQGPNILLITLDTTRADHLGSYGHEGARTPALDWLAREGARFSNAIAPVPLTLPSHATLLSGVHPDAHGVHVNLGGALHPDVRTLTQEFNVRGYRTGAFLAAWVLASKFGLSRGFDVYEDVEGKRSHSAARSGDLVVDSALKWLDAPADQGAAPPFFAWVHFFDAHQPYEPPAGFREGFEHPYDGELAFIDSQVQRLLDWLEQEGLLDSTIIIVAGDHGEGLDEHEEETHGVFLYDSTVRVPLILRGPGITPGTVCDPVVGLIDVAPSVHDLMGWPGRSDFEGNSFAPALAGEPLPAMPVFVESEYATTFGWAPLEGVVTDDWKFVEAPKPELYARGAETINVADERPDVVEALRGVLESHHEVSVTRETTEVALSESEAANLGALGYVGGSSATGREDLEELDDPKDHKGHLRGMLKALEAVQAKDYALVVTLLEPLMPTANTTLDMWTTYAASLAGVGRYTDALAAVEHGHTLGDPTASSLCARGDAERGLKQTAKAEASFLASLALDPERGQTHSRLGKLYGERGNFGKAVAHFEKYVDADPESANALTNLANAYFADRQFARGINCLQRALEFESDCVPAYLGLINIYDASGNPTEAIATLRKATRALPADPTLAGQLAWRLSTTPNARPQDAAEAIEFATAAVALVPSAPSYHDILGAAFAHAGDFPQAIASTSRALALAQNAGMSDLSVLIEARLNLYKISKPYRRP